MSGQIIEAPPMTEPLVYICWPVAGLAAAAERRVPVKKEKTRKRVNC